MAKCWLGPAIAEGIDILRRVGIEESVPLIEDVALIVILLHGIGKTECNYKNYNGHQPGGKLHSDSPNMGRSSTVEQSGSCRSTEETIPST
jgi:hypothetical protein